MASEQVEKKRSVFLDAIQFIRESKEELKKVHCPTRQETIQATVVTLFIMVFVSLVLFVLDLVLGRLMGALIG